MTVCIIGGTGHIGKFLTTMLAEAGHDVIVVTSGRTPVPRTGVWETVHSVTQTYGVPGWTDAVRALRAEVVIDILQGDSPGLYTAVRDSCGHLLVCGSLWMLGLPRTVPTPEVTQAPCLFAGYARRYQQLLETRERAAPEVHRAHRRGDRVVLPDPGNVLIGPCDAEDVARGFFCAVQNRAAAAGGVFNVGSAYALTALQFIETYGTIYGSRIPVDLVAWHTFETEVLPEPGANWHFKANMCPDITAIRNRLAYTPAYTPEQTMERAVRWMLDTHRL